MCLNKHTRDRKYQRKLVAGGEIVINRRKSLIRIYSLHEPISLPMHLVKEMPFNVNCAK